MGSRIVERSSVLDQAQPELKQGYCTSLWLSVLGWHERTVVQGEGIFRTAIYPQGWLKIVWILSTRGVFLEIVHASEMQKLWFIESCCCGYSILWYVMRVQRLQVSVSSLRTLGPIADNHHHMLAILWSQRDTHFLTPRQINNISMNICYMFDVFPVRTENLSNLALLWFKASSASSTSSKYI